MVAGEGGGDPHHEGEAKEGGGEGEGGRPRREAGWGTAPGRGGRSAIKRRGPEGGGGKDGGGSRGQRGRPAFAADDPLLEGEWEVEEGDREGIEKEGGGTGRGTTAGGSWTMVPPCRGTLTGRVQPPS